MTNSNLPTEHVIRLAADTISQGELELAAAFLTSGDQLTKGPKTLEFESKFSTYLGREYSVFVNSGSSANLLVAAALKESGRLRNLRVVCPAVSWVTTVTPFIQLGFDVSLCDADPTNLGVDVNKLRAIFERDRPSVLVLVHVLGHPNSMTEIFSLCEEFDVVVFEDSCEALGTVVPEGTMLGTSGIAASFSFYYGHHISTIEGGMVATSDYDLYQIMLSLRSHGWSRDLDPVVRSELQKENEIDDFRNLYTFYRPGFNFRSTDLQAFIGLSQISRMSKISEVRAVNHAQYREGLGSYWTQESNTLLLSSFAYGTAVTNRQEVARHLAQNGIESRPLICGNIARHPFWSRSNEHTELPVADFVHDFGMYLPNHASLSSLEVRKVIDVFSEVAQPIFPENFL
jgi:CDP-6-deoxy-D-xylo-4-hexulose-3-dehydrase